MLVSTLIIYLHNLCKPALKNLRHKKDLTTLTTVKTAVAQKGDWANHGTGNTIYLYVRYAIRNPLE
jgi:hypothetical protein